MQESPPEKTPHPAAVPSPDLVARWLGISHLLAIAGELRGRRGGAWPGLALAAADAASEALLSLLANTKKPVSPESMFPDLLQKARAAFSGQQHQIDDDLAARLDAGHLLRNQVLHRGLLASDAQADSVIRAASDLKNVAVKALAMLAAFGEGGPATVVAGYIENSSVSRPLSEAERLLRNGDPVPAAKMAAIAFHALLANVNPSLRPTRGGVSWRPGTFGRTAGRATYGDAERQLDDAFKSLGQRDAKLEAWVLALGLGLPPQELARLRALIGEPMYTISQDRMDPSAVYGGAENPTAGDVEWAILTIADIALRLVTSGALPPSPTTLTGNEVVSSQ